MPKQWCEIHKVPADTPCRRPSEEEVETRDALLASAASKRKDEGESSTVKLHILREVS